MSFSQWFGWNRVVESGEIPNIFPLPVPQGEFIETDIITIFTKILTDTLERTHGLSEKETTMMWDNCVKSSSQDGLITMLSKAICEKRDLFVVYDRAGGIVRQATSDEQLKIRDDYDKTAQSSTGVFVTFRNFRRADMIKLYIGLEYCTVSSLHKSMNLSKAIQLKMNDLRASISTIDSPEAKTQAQAIAVALSNGRDILVDGKDVIETSTPKLEAVKESIAFILQKLAFYLNLPSAYISGEQTGGLGTTGEGDAKAIDRGLKSYFFSIIKPVVDALFGKNVTYKSNDFTNIKDAMEVVKTLSITDESLINLENKTLIINRLMDLPEDARGDEPREVIETPAPPGANAPPSPARASAGPFA